MRVEAGHRQAAPSARSAVAAPSTVLSCVCTTRVVHPRPSPNPSQRRQPPPSAPKTQQFTGLTSIPRSRAAWEGASWEAGGCCGRNGKIVSEVLSRKFFSTRLGSSMYQFPCGILRGSNSARPGKQKPTCAGRQKGVAVALVDHPTSSNPVAALEGKVLQRYAQGYSGINVGTAPPRPIAFLLVPPPRHPPPPPSCANDELVRATAPGAPRAILPTTS
ncbi:hypothetical protein ACHAXT_005483 [Thalassiosira profunda]